MQTKNLRSKNSKDRPYFFAKYKKNRSDSVLFALASHYNNLLGNRHTFDSRDYFKVISDIQCDYSLSVEEVRITRQLMSLVSKNADFGNNESRKLAAIDAFFVSEEACKSTNRRYHQNLVKCQTERNYMRQLIANILGEVPEIADLQLAFGPGANVNVKNVTNVRHKLDAYPACSQELYPYLDAMFATCPAFGHTHMWEAAVVRGELTTVPKNWKIDRTIMMEPSMNTLLQKGIGTHIKNRLMDRGINLRDQSLNKKRAQLASITNHLATIDYSSASDSISVGVVIDLLPPKWLELLCIARTSCVNTPRGPVMLQKFSSMGNAYTFELESLIFYALGHTCCVLNDLPGHLTSIYGDDLIVPSRVYNSVCRLSAELGFRINDEKSFHNGPFRESCGGDYLDGLNVRPFYVKDRFSDATIISLLNFDFRNFKLIDKDLRCFLLSLLRPEHKNFGPDKCGDGHIVSDTFVPPRDTWARSIQDRDGQPKYPGWEGYFFFTITAKKKNDGVKSLPYGDDLTPSYLLSLRSPCDASVWRWSRDQRIRGFQLRNYATVLIEDEAIPGLIRVSNKNFSDSSVDINTMRGRDTAKLTKIYMLR